MGNNTQVRLIAENVSAEDIVNLEGCCNLDDVATADGKAEFTSKSATMHSGSFEGDDYVFTVEVAPRKTGMVEGFSPSPIKLDDSDPRLDSLIRRARVYNPDEPSS